MLPAGSRLRRRADFGAATRRGAGAVRAAQPTLVVHLGVPVSASPQRLAGFVVPRAVGGAVVRNRVKRRLCHLVRDRLEKLPPGAHLVVRAQPAAATASSAQLSMDLDRALASGIDALLRRQRRSRNGGTAGPASGVPVAAAANGEPA
ncbi:MAG: ribonuclease P protein component [Actinomycetota bacterium]|nr:ribonuclease P protein component [Actinomycetota bacterium]